MLSALLLLPSLQHCMLPLRGTRSSALKHVSRRGEWPGCLLSAPPRARAQYCQTAMQGQTVKHGHNLDIRKHKHNCLQCIQDVQYMCTAESVGAVLHCTCVHNDARIAPDPDCMMPVLFVSSCFPECAFPLTSRSAVGRHGEEPTQQGACLRAAHGHLDAYVA
jgi:hypothetical protein